MKKKILGLIALLLIGGGIYLWWLGNRTVLTEAQKAEEARQLEIKQAQETRRRMEEQIRAVSTSTRETITNAIQAKKGPLQTFTPDELTKNQYTLLDLKVVSPETATSRSAYQTGIKKILNDYSTGLAGDELGAMLAYLENHSTTTLKLITDSEANLKKTLTSLAKLPVPASASFLHLQLLNSFASLRQIIYNMSQVASEPLLATESARHREESYVAIVSNIGLLSRYLSNPITP